MHQAWHGSTPVCALRNAVASAVVAWSVALTPVRVHCSNLQTTVRIAAADASLRRVSGADSNQKSHSPTHYSARLPDPRAPGAYGHRPPVPWPSQVPLPRQAPTHPSAPVPPRRAAIVPLKLPQLPGFVPKVKPSAWVEVGLGLPWLWWSWLSIQFLGVPWRGLYWIGLAVWGASAAVVVLHPRAENLLAWRVYRLRAPSAWESQRLGPAWWAVCAAAGVDPDRYRVWVHEEPEATAPITPGSTVAVTSWA